jgi:hypothetical protein
MWLYSLSATNTNKNTNKQTTNTSGVEYSQLTLNILNAPLLPHCQQQCATGLSKQASKQASKKASKQAKQQTANKQTKTPPTATSKTHKPHRARQRQPALAITCDRQESYCQLSVLKAAEDRSQKKRRRAILRVDTRVLCFVSLFVLELIVARRRVDARFCTSTRMLCLV